MTISNRLQFGFGPVLAFVAVVAVCVAYWPVAAEVLFRYATLLFVGAALAGFGIGAWCTKHDAAQRRTFSVLRAFVLAFAIALLVIVVWCRHRWTTHAIDAAFPRDFPYPDVLLKAVHDWLDETRPVEDGMFKIHGEYYAVLNWLNWITLGSSSFFGLSAGWFIPLRLGRYMKDLIGLIVCRNGRDVA